MDGTPKNGVPFLCTLLVPPARLDLGLSEPYHQKFAAGVAKLVYAPDSKSDELNAHVGSTPTSGTKIQTSANR